MNFALNLPRWAFAALSVGAVFGLVAFTYPGGLQAAYSDLRDSPELNESVSAAKQRHGELNTRSNVVHERIAIKEALVQDVIDGRADLWSVADRFRELNENDPITMNALRTRFGELPTDELVTRNVIDYVRRRTGTGVASSATLDQLHRQFERRFGKRVSAD